MSIRIPSGQSLHWEDVEQAHEGDNIEVVVEGPIVVGYPREMAESLCIEEVLQNAGVTIEEGYCAVSIEGAGSVWYVARVTSQSAEALDKLRRSGCSVRLTTPLEELVVAAVAALKRPKNIFLSQIDSTLYVAYAESHRLRYAEAIPIGGESDLINLLALLNQDFELRKAEFTLVGEECCKYQKTIRKYFRRVVCRK